MYIEPADGPRFQPVVVLFGAVLAGATCDRFLTVPLLAWPVLAIGSLLAWGGVRRTAAIRGGSALVLLATFATAALWHHLQWRLFSADDLGLSARPRSSPVYAEVIALSSPRRQPVPPPNPMNTMREQEEMHLLVQVVRARDGRDWHTASGRAMLRVTGALTSIQAGDRLRVLAQLSSPGAPLNPGEPDFAQYERSERRLFRLHAETTECLQVLEKGSRGTLAYWLNSVRDHCDANLWRHVSPARADWPQRYCLARASKSIALAMRIS